MAGYIFGAWGGLLLCVLGSLLGSFLIILAVRTWGMKLVKLFVTENQLASMRFFKDTKKRDATIFLLFLLPGTPKDALTYLCGLVPMRSWQYLLLTTLARAPSILFSTMGGHLLGEEEYRRAVLILGITLALTLAAALAYRAHQRKAATAAKAPSDPGTGEGENVKDRGADDVPS